jgi:hypothetical protein
MPLLPKGASEQDQSHHSRAHQRAGNQQKTGDHPARKDRPGTQNCKEAQSDHPFRPDARRQPAI